MKSVKISVNNVEIKKDVKIFQHQDYFKFGLDSILLSNFVKLKYSVKKILDIGTGNAPIPLILSSKTDAKIVGVEIQKELFLLAKKSVKKNNLSNQIIIINEDINNYYKKLESDVFDVITCNPPYFKFSESSIVNSSKHKTIARHEVTLNLQQLCKIAKKLLKNGGKFALIHRTERIIEVINMLRDNNLEPKRIQLIYTDNEKDSELFLIESVKNGKTGLKFLYPIFLNKNNC